MFMNVIKKESNFEILSITNKALYQSFILKVIVQNYELKYA